MDTGYSCHHLWLFSHLVAKRIRGFKYKGFEGPRGQGFEGNALKNILALDPLNPGKDSNPFGDEPDLIINS